MNGVNVDNNSINVDNNSQIEREIETEREIEIENEIEIESEKEKEINIYELQSIYPSNHKIGENRNLDEMMDEMEKMEFDMIISNCEMHILSPELAIEITEILKEMYMTPITRKRVLEVNSKKLLYALKNFAIANTKSRIQMPKAYFKKCILSALDQTELSTQYDASTIMDEMSNFEGG